MVWKVSGNEKKYGLSPGVYSTPSREREIIIEKASTGVIHFKLC